NTDQQLALDKQKQYSQDPAWTHRAVYPEILAQEFDQFEFDIRLTRIPDNNVFTYNIETDNLEFYYQSELTQDQIDQGTIQPENVTGSYAVYHSQRKTLYNSQSEAQKHQTGKAFHIYRPKIIAHDGQWTWGQLDIDTQAKTLAVTVNPDWLNQAAYP